MQLDPRSSSRADAAAKMTTGGGEGLVGYFFEVAAAEICPRAAAAEGEWVMSGIFFEWSPGVMCGVLC